MAEAQSLQRTVGFWGATLFPINGMIGAGIFALPAILVTAVGNLPAILVTAVGNLAPWMMLFGALLILPLAFVLSTLATRFDRHGGPVLYAHAAFGSYVGFQSGWTRYEVAVAANTQVAVAYLAVLFPVLGIPC